MKNQVSQIALSLELKEAQVVAFLDLLNHHPVIDLKELVRQTGWPETHLKRVLKAFDYLLEPSSHQVIVKADKLAELNTFLQDKQTLWENNEDTQTLLTSLTAYQAHRPQPKREYDQFYATLDTTIKRALALKQRGELYRQNILFLGDDDLTSVACALIATDCRFTVVDIDPRQLTFIERLAQENHLNIQTQTLDLRQDSLTGDFDVVFTDPPYTPEGISLFLNRAIQSLKKRLTSRIYLCFGTSSRAAQKEIVIQSIINQRRLLIQEKIKDFNHYLGAESIGSTSSLYILGVTPQTKVLPISSPKIYTHE